MATKWCFLAIMAV